MLNKMTGRPSMATRIQAGDRLAPLELVTIHGQHVRISAFIRQTCARPVQCQTPSRETA